MTTNHPITKLETAIRRVVRHQINGGFTDNTPQQNEDKATAALTALCREYAASELRLLAGSDEDMANYYGDEPYSQIKGEIDGRNELRRTLRVRADELEAE